LERGGTMQGMKIMGAGLLLASIALVLFCPAADAAGYQFSAVYYNPIWWDSGNTATAHFSGTDMLISAAMTTCSSPG